MVNVIGEVGTRLRGRRCRAYPSDVRFFPLANLPDDILPPHRDRLEGYRWYEGKFLLLQ